MPPIRILVVGCGHMGAAHAKAYHALEQFEIVGLVSRGGDARAQLSHDLSPNPNSPIAQFENFATALQATQPDAVAINTYPDTHAAYALLALEAGAHVFVEKPLGVNFADAVKVLNRARQLNRKVVVGYILQHHPGYRGLIAQAKTLGKPLVMRMNLNQPSSGKMWQKHLRLLEFNSPLVDCGVHYVDIMTEAAESPVIRVQAIGARLSDSIPAGMINYGQMQVIFANGSVGWFEASWGPMFNQINNLRDITGPLGNTGFTPKTHDPDHQALCELEQAFFLRAIQEDLDLSAHHQRVLTSLKVVLAAEQSWRTGLPVTL
jgi:predicted dehydrogenase